MDLNRYILLHTPTAGVFSDTPIIEGKSGVDALNTCEQFSHFIGKFKRVSGWETPEYCLQRVIERDGQLYSRGNKYWYKYHHPKIERIV